MNATKSVASTRSGRKPSFGRASAVLFDELTIFQQVEGLQAFFSSDVATALVDRAGEDLVRDLRLLADAFEQRWSLQYGVCPAGHALSPKLVSGSLFHGSKHCSCCDAPCTVNSMRFSCKQCAFHLCNKCYRNDSTKGEHGGADMTLLGAKDADPSAVQTRVRAKTDPVQWPPVVPAADKHANVDAAKDFPNKVGGNKKRPTVRFSPSSNFEDVADGPPKDVSPQAMAMPVLETKAGWCVKGVYEHQALHIGLRQLQTRAHVLKEPPAERKKHMIKEKLLMDLMAGNISLATVHANDLRAAQRDLSGLSVHQLLDFRVKNDMTLSGPQGEFLVALESALYEKLGRCAAGSITTGTPCDVDDRRRVGREAVLLVAAAAAIPCTSVWCWWIMGERVFFDAATFACVETFPDTGVLEFSDYSRVERFAGRVIDWQVRYARDQRDLMSPDEHKRRRTTSMDISLQVITDQRAALRSATGARARAQSAH